MYRRFTVVLITILFSILQTSGNKLRLHKNKLKTGEKLEYTADWGILTIGSAVTVVDNYLFRLGDNICYKINVNASTNGIASLFYMKNNWTAYIDTASLTTHRSYRSIREGTYQKEEIVYFDHKNKKATVSVYNKNLNKYTVRKIYDTPPEIRDYVAGFLLVRMIDFERYRKGEKLTISGFYEEKGYKVELIYQGKELIRYKKTDVLCYKIIPILPDKSAFDGKNAVSLWITADKSQKILKARAKTFFGYISLNLK